MLDFQATQEETDVEKALRQNVQVAVHTTWGSTLVHRDDLPFHIKQ